MTGGPSVYVFVLILEAKFNNATSLNQSCSETVWKTNLPNYSDRVSGASEQSDASGVLLLDQNNGIGDI